MYKVGDEVLIKGEVIEVVNDVPYPVKVRLGSDNGGLVFTNDELCYSDKIVKTYEMGLSDAWELAKKISLPVSRGGLSCDEFAKIFGDIYTNDVFFNLTATEALAKIEVYEKEKEIKVGSIVGNCAGDFGVVTGVERERYYVVWSDGSCNSYEKERLTNTGKTTKFLKELFRQIREQ